MATPTSSCPRCGAQLEPVTVDGLCPKCLLTAFLAPEPPPAEAGMRVGGHVVIEEIDTGGMGVVFRAREPSLNRVVALKMLKGGAFAPDEEQRRFRDEARQTAMLDHPNIVRILQEGEAEDDKGPFFTMELMERGSLAKNLRHFRADRRRAAALVGMIARAVQHAHDRGVLHRDLKPANVLLDEHWRPVLADFGAAKELGKFQGLTRTGTVVGTASYMAPEQARGEKTITVDADTWGLGAILYELLTGRPPFEGKDYDETLHWVREREPTGPRSIDPEIDPRLETICLKCLQKNPSRRYRSAAEVAEEVDRYLRDEPILALPIGQAERAWRWGRAHPVIAGSAVALLIAAATALSASLQQEERSREEILAANAYAARMAAGAILLELRQDAETFQFRQYADQVQRPAQDSELIRLLEARDHQALRLAALPLGAAVPRGLSPFDSWLVLDGAGAARARWPTPPSGYFPRDFARRDFYLGARTIARAGKRTVHVSQAFEDEADGRARVAFSTPMFGSDGTMVGVVVATIAPASALGSTQLGVAGDPNRTGALVGPRDPSQPQAGGTSSDLVFLFHDGLERGRLAPFDERQLARPEALANAAVMPTGAQLQPPAPTRVGSAEHYLDPFPGFGGRWLAGLAPVGDTGLVVVVQTRYQVVLEPIVRALEFVALPLGAGLLAVLTAIGIRRRRSGRAEEQQLRAASPGAPRPRPAPRTTSRAWRAWGPVVLSTALAAGAWYLVERDGAQRSPSPGRPAEAGSGDLAPIVLGEVGSLTGPDAEDGISTRNGIELAVNEANLHGGVKGRRLALHVYDDQSKPEGAARAARRLVEEDQVVLILGETASTNSLAMAPVAQAAGVPMVTPASTNPAVTEVGDYVFRACFSDAFQGLVMARYARESLKVGQVGVLFERDSVYSQWLAREFERRFTELGGAVAASASYRKGDTDFRAQLGAIQEKKPEAIYLPGYVAEVVLIAQQARHLGLQATLLGADAWDSEKLFETGASAINGSLVTNHYWKEDPAAQDFARSYQRAFGSVPDARAALGYDAARLALDALQRAPDSTGPALRDALARTRGFAGATGRISIDERRDAVKPVVVLVVDDGRFRLVKTVAP